MNIKIEKQDQNQLILVLFLANDPNCDTNESPFGVRGFTIRQGDSPIGNPITRKN